MGLFTWVKRVNPNKIIDYAASGIDALALTKEEKADKLQKIADTHLELAKVTINSKHSAEHSET